MPRVALSILALLSALGTVHSQARAQFSSGYPERDILTPFRTCTEISAPPEQQFEQLRIMMSLANDFASSRHFDEKGREIVDDSRWEEAYKRLQRLPLDAGHLAILMRQGRNADDRAVAFYAMFFCRNPANVFNLISHIPGEPVRRTREESYPRAIEYLRAHIAKTYGDLSPEQKQALDLPQPGSPRAKQLGITRAPVDTDLLFSINLKPFFQLLDLGDSFDQAQGLWFLRECFTLRKDLATAWLEPALPRVTELLVSNDERVREQAAGLLESIAPKDLETPPLDSSDDILRKWAREASLEMFPPIRLVSAGLMALLPSPERDAIMAAGKKALLEGIGEATYGETPDGFPYRGFRIDQVPEDLAILGIPRGVIVTAVNGVPVNDGKHLLEVLDKLFVMNDKDGKPQRITRRNLIVEYIEKGKTKAIEYRVL